MVMETVVVRFLRYVRIDTQSREGTGAVPSTAKQLDLCRLLERELQSLGLADVRLSPQGVVTATIPATVSHAAPTIVFTAHVDTAPGYSGANVRPILHSNYDGRDLVLPGDPRQVLRASENPALARLLGDTIITTDGTTLLGADDKAGVAAIMTAAAELLARRDLPTGPIKLVFTCDEEIGHGIDHIDLAELGAVCAYTLDGEGQGIIDCETFSADQAVITVTGVDIHPSIGFGRMVNALRILCDFVARLPQRTLSPETTQGRAGFLHPYFLEGTVERALVRILLRDFETDNLAEQRRILESIAVSLAAEHPQAKIGLEFRAQYRNMRDGLTSEPRAVAKAVEAMRNIGLEPELSIIRGGTDGSRLTEAGLPTPNLSTGEHNPHSPLEWTSQSELETAVKVLVSLAQAWSVERVA